MKKVLCRGVSFLSFFFFFLSSCCGRLVLYAAEATLSELRWGFCQTLMELCTAGEDICELRKHTQQLNYLSAAAHSWRIHVCSLMEWSCRCFLRTLTFPNRWLRRICCTLFLICLFYAHKLSIMQKINIIYNRILWSYKFKNPKTLVVIPLKAFKFFLCLLLVLLRLSHTL